MMTSSPAHLEDAALMRLIDDPDSPQATGDARHAAGCAACAAELQALRDRDAFVRSWIRRTTPAPAPPLRHRTRRPAPAAARHRAAAWLRAAAVIAVIAAPVAASPQLREWVAERADSVLGRSAPSLRSVAGEPAAPASRVFRFLPAPGDFDVVIDGAGAGSALRVLRSDGSEASLAIADEGADPPLITAGGVHLHGSGTRDAEYVLQVPATIQRVRIQAAGGIRFVTAAEIDAGARVPL
jgi:hypothetical protein